MSAAPTLPLAKSTVWSARIFLVLLAVGGIYNAIQDKQTGLIWGLFILVCGLLVVAGLYVSTKTAPWKAVLLIVVGTLVGSAPLWWSLVVPLAGFVLVGLVARDARHTAPMTVQPTG